MSKLNIELIKTISKKLCENYDFADPLDYIDIDELKECEDVYDIVQLFTDANDDREITDTEIIYYTTAMDYLKANDARLQTSLGLAAEMGYTCDKLSSEMLASILASDENLEDYNTFLEELEKELDTVENLFAKTV